MKKFAILRVKKLKSKRAVTGSMVHTLRVAQPANADPDRKHLNQLEKRFKDMTPEEVLGVAQKRVRGLAGDKKARKNAVHGHEWVVTCSPEHLETMSPKERTSYFSDALKYLDELHGGIKYRACMAIHQDEKTPHMHVVYATIENGKGLSAKIIGGHRDRLSRLQTDFYENVAKKYEMDRGIKKSPAKHTSVKQYYSELPQKIKGLNDEIGVKTTVSLDMDLAISRAKAEIVELNKEKSKAVDYLRKLKDLISEKSPIAKQIKAWIKRKPEAKEIKEKVVSLAHELKSLSNELAEAKSTIAYGSEIKGHLTEWESRLRGLGSLDREITIYARRMDILSKRYDASWATESVDEMKEFILDAETYAPDMKRTEEGVKRAKQMVEDEASQRPRMRR